MKKSLLVLFTTFLLVGCTSKGTSGGNTPSGGGGGTPSGSPTVLNADFTTGSPTGGSDTSGFDTKFLSYFGDQVSNYVSSATISGYAQINGKERIPEEGASKVTDYRFTLGSKGAGKTNSSLTLAFVKPLSKIEFFSECVWSGFLEGGTGPYTKKIEEDFVSLTVGSESFTLRDTANGNDGGFSLEKHEVSFASPVTSLVLQGNGRVAFSSITITVLA